MPRDSVRLQQRRANAIHDTPGAVTNRSFIANYTRHRVRPGRRIYNFRDVRDGGVATSQETLLISEARMAIGVALEKVAK
jgi:hypothetical protein